MVKLRLRRMGKRHYPVYKIVAADSRSPRDGRFIESVGTYNPNIDPMEIKLNESRVKYWLKVGAKPTDTVMSLLRSEGFILKLRLEKKKIDSAEIESQVKNFLTLRASKIERLKEKKKRRNQVKKSKKDSKETGEKVSEEKKEE